jgi:integrase
LEVVDSTGAAPEWGADASYSKFCCLAARQFFPVLAFLHGRPRSLPQNREAQSPARAGARARADEAPPAAGHAGRSLGSGADAIRTSIAKACKAAGVPLWSPHDLRHRRISLLHLRGVPWVRIAEFVGQRDLSVTADTYTHVLADEKELDYEALLAA